MLTLQLRRSTPFVDRANAGQIVETLNDTIAIPDNPMEPAPESRIKLLANTEIKKFSYRPMAMHLSEASEVLDDRLDEFAQIIQNHHHLEDNAFGNPASQSTTEIVVVGRICSDSLGGGKLNAASLMLESSRRMGAGLRVPLKVDKLSSYDFFPGQVVAVKGVNASGDYFSATEILDLPLLPPAANKPALLDTHNERLGGGPDAMEDEVRPLNIIIGSGPYTADDNLDFEPLHAICEEASLTRADALILAGPLLDIEHPLISSGDFDIPEDLNVDPDTSTLSQVFRALVSPPLRRLAEQNPSIQILIVPSVRDAASKHVSYPTEPLGGGSAAAKKELGLPKQSRLVSNPITITFNEIVIGISAADILWELRSGEVAYNAKEHNPLARLSRLLIEQRHFFPAFPPGQGFGGGMGVSLDTSYLKLAEWLTVRPDVLIIPSALAPFAKVSAL
jgi:DNA polymerase alpha subunit B